MPEKLKEMRLRTNLPLMKCKEYLIKADWDVEKAIKLAREDHFRDSPFILR